MHKVGRMGRRVGMEGLHIFIFAGLDVCNHLSKSEASLWNLPSKLITKYWQKKSTNIGNIGE